MLLLQAKKMMNQNQTKTKTHQNLIKNIRRRKASKVAQHLLTRKKLLHQNLTKKIEENARKEVKSNKKQRKRKKGIEKNAATKQKEMFSYC